MNGFYWIYAVMALLMVGEIFLKKPEQKNFWFYIGGFVLVLMLAVQDIDTGIDLHNYLYFYNEITELDFAGMLAYETWEFGFVVLNKLAYLMGMGPRMLYLLLGAVMLVPLFLWMKRESGIPIMSLFLFVALGFYAFSIGIFRQWCAIAVLMNTTLFIRKKKPVCFLLMVGLAMLFHRTAGVFAVVYLISLLPVNHYIMMLAAAGSVACGLLGQPILHILNLFVRVPESAGFNGGITMYAVLWILTLAAYWLLHGQLKDPKVKIPFMMLLFGAATQSIAFTFSNYARIVWYFSISLVVLIPQMYLALFGDNGENLAIVGLQKRSPRLYERLSRLCRDKRVQLFVRICAAAVLFVWYMSSLDGAVYKLALLDY